MGPFIHSGTGSVRSLAAARLEELFTCRRSRHDPEALVRFLVSNFGLHEATVRSVMCGSTDLDFATRRQMQRLIDQRLSGAAGQEAVELFRWNGVSKCLRADFFGPRTEWDQALTEKLVDHAKAEKPEGTRMKRKSLEAKPAPTAEEQADQAARAVRAAPPVKKRREGRPPVRISTAAPPADPIRATPIPVPVRAPAPAPTTWPLPQEFGPASDALEARFPNREIREATLKTWYAANGSTAIHFSPDVAAFSLAMRIGAAPERIESWVKMGERLGRLDAEKLHAALG